MKNWLEKIKYKLSLCYGNDDLNRFLNRWSVVLCFLSFIPKMHFLIFVAIAILIYTAFRCFSRNKYNRQRELYEYMKVKNRAEKKRAFWKLVFKERKSYKYFRCPKCKAILRVPRHRGTIIVTCRECKEKFEKKTGKKK